MDIAATIRAEDRAWAEMHGLDELELEFYRMIARAALRNEVRPPIEHTEHAVTRTFRANWSQFMDLGTQIIRGTE